MTELQILQTRLETEKDIKDAIYCTIEEMSEATKIMTKYLRNSSKFSLENLQEEVAHSLLMLNVIKNIFGINDESIENEQIFALKRCFKINT